MIARSIAIPAASLLLASVVHAQYFEARNSAMGGTGVASSHYLAAGWANPALLTRHRESDTFGFILPTVGATAFDKDGLIDDIDSFVDDFDRIEAAGTATTDDINSLADQLESLDGRQVTGTLGVGFVVGAPSRDLGWSLHARTYADLQSFVDVDPADVAAIRGLTAGSVTLPTLNSEARVVGIAITEVGVSLATSFDIAGTTLSVGATPKLQRVDSYNYAVTADNFDQDNFDDDQFRDDDQQFNFDLGAAWEPGAGLTFGATVRNMIDKSYRTRSISAGSGLPANSYLYDVNPAAALGASWTTGILTLAADVDLVSAERFEDSPQLDKDDVQLAHLGAEIDLFSWLQLRGGYQTDFENTLDDAYSAGLGISPFDVFHLDVAGTYIDDKSYGGVIQMGFTF
jgi:hypothetical protein